ncbi:T9SS type A sorting domain-containing protein [Algoriphagus winogradskyi]|uniref:Por secretion system C-terminal sorting domain-containing protein n=1 Tax=Algoriphagus winogradskyi TaxID=237017 RepID=A0ABY1N8S5_9BACT|nr:T9SS type A sorting domain-containing protein [Algoriphagus winogradskyi]SMP03541.1 Por secretion system C-terminal sorting domain-containing protein [Algoriphagus winogradskyi]
MKKHLLFSFGLLICLTFMSLKVSEVNPYRIYPYLQVYGEGKMQLTWFGNSLTSSFIKLVGDSGNVLYEGEVTGEPVPNIYYTSQEKSQVLTGLEQGSWIESDEVFRYRIPIDLPAGTAVNYLVTLGGVTYDGAFTMPASKSNWEKIRFMALADSETEPRGRVTNRAWYPGNPLFRPITTVPELWKQKFGSTIEQGIEIPNYMLTEQVGYNENLKVINSRNPNFILMPGDLVQGAGYQPGWDEFFRQNAGSMGKGLSSYAIIPALGNWESYGAISGGYGTNERGEFLPVVGRNRFHTYFETPIEDPLQKHKKSYYRVDYGPVTILTLDSSNGTPDQTAADFDGQPKLTGKQYTEPGTDTQENYTLAQYNAAGGKDLSSFGPGSDQYIWLEENLKDASENGQLIFVQYHHIAFSSGEHGVPLNHELSIGQVGTPMRILNPMLEKYGVVAVFSGHDELFERSFVDEDSDGKGIMYYDVGVAGDGLRGEKRDWLGNPFNTLDYNPYRKWSADQSSVEVWNTSGGNPVLVDGGKHYGHLEVNLEKKVEGDQEFAIVNFTPVYIFPVLDQNYNLQKVERRVYKDEVSLKIPLRKTEAKPVVKDRVELVLNAEGKATLKPEQVFTNWPISSIYTVTLSKSDFSCENLGAQEVTVIIKDDKGNTWEDKIEVVVQDKSAPVVQTNNLEVELDLAKGQLELSPEDFIQSISDNCAVKEVTISKTKVTCEDVGKELTVELRAVDFSGNVTEKNTTVLVRSFTSSPVTITGSESICGGTKQSLTLNSEAPFEVVRWRKNGTEISGATGKALEIEGAGTYKAVIRFAGACLFETDEFIVKAANTTPVTITGSESICGGTKQTLTLKSEAAFEVVKWRRNGTEISGAIGKTLEIETAGTYQAIVKNGGGCLVETPNFIVKEASSTPVTITGSESICVGTKQTLTLKSEAAFEVVKWRRNGTEITGASGKTIEIETAGTYQAIVKNGGGCLVETPNFIVKEANATPVTITGSESICVGSKQTLTLKSEAAFEVVKWRRNGTEISGATGKTLEIETAGTYQAIVRNAGGCLVETPNFIVKEANSTPVTITGSETICVGTKQTLTLKSEAAFEVVKWRRNGTEITGATGKTLEIESAGTYQAIVRTAGGCLVETADFIVKETATAAVSISGPATICAGDKQLLTLASEAEFEVVRWRRNGTEISGATNKTLEIEEGGSYHAIVRLAGGCLVETEKFVVESAAKPSGEIIVDGNILKAPEGNFTYQWYRNGEKLEGDTKQKLTVNQMGEFSVELTNEAGCTTRLVPVIMTISGIFNPGILVSEELKIYPNPASSQVEIQALGDLKFAANSMRIYDNSGKQVSSSVEVIRQSSRSVTLAIPRLSAGTYVIMVESDDNRVFVGKMIKQ